MNFDYSKHYKNIKGSKKVGMHVESKWLIENNMQHSLIDNHARMNVSDDH